MSPPSLQCGKQGHGRRRWVVERLDPPVPCLLLPILPLLPALPPTVSASLALPLPLHLFPHCHLPPPLPLTFSCGSGPGLALVRQQQLWQWQLVLALSPSLCQNWSCSTSAWLGRGQRHHVLCALGQSETGAVTEGTQCLRGQGSSCG